MTKQQAIKILGQFGCTNIIPDGKFCVYLNTPSGERALVDPKDFARELQLRATQVDTHLKIDPFFDHEPCYMAETNAFITAYYQRNPDALREIEAL
jgi:hypothetical protein